MKYNKAFNLCEERKNGVEFIKDASSQSFSIMFKNFKLMVLNNFSPNNIYKNHWKNELSQPILDMVQSCGGKFNKEALLNKMMLNSTEDFKRLIKETLKKYSSMITEKDIVNEKSMIISKTFEIYNNVINIVVDNFDKPEEEQREKVFSYVNSLYP